MALTPTITSVDATGQNIIVTFNLAASGNYPTGGDTVNLATAAADAAFQGVFAGIESSQLLQFDVWTQGGNLTRDYVAIKGSGPSNSKVKMNTTKGSTTELGAGGYPADVTGDSITGMAVFAKLL